MNEIMLLIGLENYNLLNAYTWILKNNPSNNLPYHNFNHIQTVTYRTIQASIYYNLSPIGKKELYLAALFHDYAHSVGINEDSENIIEAKKNLNDFLLLNPIKDINIGKIEAIIDATEYPYLLKEEDLNLEQKIIRDCDLMQILEPNYIQQILMGLHQESKKTLDFKNDFSTIVNNQLNFVKSIKPLTEWGDIIYKMESQDVINKLYKLSKI
jgi:hypothetical protein